MPGRFAPVPFGLILLAIVAIALLSCSKDNPVETRTTLQEELDAARQAMEDELYRHLQVDAPDPETPDDVNFNHAREHYEAALQRDANNPTARFGVAVTTLLTLSMDTEINDAFDEWKNFLEDGAPFEVQNGAFQPLGVPLFLADPAHALRFPFQIIPGTAMAMSGAAVFEANPKISAVQDLLLSTVLPRLDNATTNLEVVLNDPSFTYTITPRMRGDELADSQELDHTDVEILFAACQLLRGACHVAVAYDLSIESYDIDGIHEALDQQTGTMFRLRTGGDAHMAAVLPLFRSAVDHLSLGITSLLAEDPAEQSDDYIKIGPRLPDEQEVRNWLNNHLPKIRAALDGPSTYALDWDDDADTPDAPLTMNLKDFFENPVADFKLKAPPYVITTVRRPWGAEVDFDSSGVASIGPVVITTGGSYSASMSVSEYDFETEDPYFMGDQEFHSAMASFISSKLAEIESRPLWDGDAWVHVSFSGSLQPGSRTVSVQWNSSYETADHIVNVPVLHWQATTYAQWSGSFPDPTMNGLFPDFTSADDFIGLFDQHPESEWDQAIVLDWTGIDWR
jgi:hypothetical protein